MKIFAQIVPLVQLTLKDNFIFWCVKDHSLSDEIVSLNSEFAKRLGIKTGEKFKISVGPFKCVDLTKVVVSLPNFKDDWSFLHENYEFIQSLILDQIRLIKRSDQYPIYTNIRKQPLWIKVEEFGGYQPSNKLGIIADNTELVIIDTCDIKTENNFDFPSFIAVPHFGFEFMCNSQYKLPRICSFNDHYFKVLQNEAVPQNVLLVPEIILRDVFKLNPKQNIKLGDGSNISSIDYSNVVHYSVDGLKCHFNESEHLKESIISSPNGIAVKMPQTVSKEVIVIKSKVPGELNEFAQFLNKTLKKFILFHGSAGTGKTKCVREATQQLNFKPDFLYQIFYIDLLTSDFNSTQNSGLFLFDHVDEYLQAETEIDDKTIRKYVNLYRKIAELLLQRNNRIVFISRSPKSFSPFSKVLTLPFDSTFSLETSKTWKFSKTSEELNCVFGLTEAKKSLERHILNPLQFSDIYHANQMNLYSSVFICGPTGSGKTFLAQKFIEHYNIKCISVHGPEILDKYVGSSERGVRDLFSRARDMKPCVIFFDEIDSLVPKRGSNQSGVTDRIVNQFLTELDGTEDRSGIFIIATTSRPDLIDKAILRPGRIDQRIELSYPTLDEIKQYISGKGIKYKKMKPLTNFLQSNPEIKISWADLVSVDWSVPENSLSNLIKSLPVPKRVNLNSTPYKQRLSLA